VELTFAKAAAAGRALFAVSFPPEDFSPVEAPMQFAAARPRIARTHTEIKHFSPVRTESPTLHNAHPFIKAYPFHPRRSMGDAGRNCSLEMSIGKE
jgi:hypothetical protein